MFVIRGKNGMRFESCSIGNLDEEETYETFEMAQMAMKQIQESIPFEQFEIISQWREQ